MKIYRIAQKKFIDDLSGEGARLYGGRWNREGDAVVYFCESLSLCVLELLTRIDFKFLTDDYYYLVVEIPDEFSRFKINPKDLPDNWRNNPPISATQDFGSRWLKLNKQFALKIPSAVLSQEFNYLINPNHPSASKLKVIKTGKLSLDSRVYD